MKAIRRESQDIDYVVLKFPMTIHGPNGDVKGKRGDYLITEGDRQYFMRPDEFSAVFMPKVDPPNAPPTYVPYPVPYTVPQPYPVYPQPYYQPYRSPFWYGTITTATSGNIAASAKDITLQGVVNGGLASVAAGGLTSYQLSTGTVGD